MLKKIYKYFFIIIVSFFLLLMIVLTFNSEIRRTSLDYLINGYKVYMIISLQPELKKDNPNFSKINEKLQGYLRTSKKIANGKSKILIGVYDSAKLVQSRIVDEKTHGVFEDFNKNLVIMDPLMYEAKIWYAKSLYANGNINESINQLKDAIKLSQLDPYPYRFGIKIAKEINDENLIKNLCKDFLSSKMGGKQKRFSGQFFSGFNLNKFGLQFVNQKEKSEIFTYIGTSLNRFDIYEISPTKPINVSSINLFFSFIPGIKLEIKKINLHFNETVKELLIKDVLINSNNSFFDNNALYFIKNNDEKITISFKKKYKNLEKISLVMNIKKMGLTNIYCKD